MHRPHLIHEYERTQWLVGQPPVAEDRLDLVFSATKRDYDVRMIVNVEIDGLAGLEINFPDSNVLVLEQNPLSHFSEFDTPFGGGLNSALIGHVITKASFFVRSNGDRIDLD